MLDFRTKTEYVCLHHSKSFYLLGIPVAKIPIKVTNKKSLEFWSLPRAIITALATLPPSTIHSASRFNGLFSPLNYLVKWRMEMVVLWFSKFVWVLLCRQRENKKGKRGEKEGICMKELGQVKGKILVCYLGLRNLWLPSLITLLGWLHYPVHPGQFWSMPSVRLWLSIVLTTLSRYSSLDDKSYGGPFKHVLFSAQSGFMEEN